MDLSRAAYEALVTSRPRVGKRRIECEWEFPGESPMILAETTRRAAGSTALAAREAGNQVRLVDTTKMQVLLRPRNPRDRRYRVKTPQERTGRRRWLA